MRLEDQVGEVVARRVAAVEVPAADPAGVVRRGRALRRRRRLVRDGLVVALVVAVVGPVLVAVLGSSLVGRDRDGAATSGPQVLRPVGGLDYSEGLRAVASPDGGVQLGGRSFDPGDVPDLDTAATTTAYGMVFFDASDHPRLLTQEGVFADLGSPGASSPAGYRPSSRADAEQPLVAFTLPRAGGVRVVLHDLEAGGRVAELDLDCGSCEEVRLEAVDRGLVFVRTVDGTYVWDSGALDDASLTLVGDGEFRLADARGGRLLWSGAPPAPEPGSPVVDWPATEGAIDSSLSFDGRHVLGWSNVLEPTVRGERAVRLDVDAVFYAFDTDGSVLAATLGGDESEVYDCVLPAGRCERVGAVSTASGDPIFPGTDR